MGIRFAILPLLTPIVLIGNSLVQYKGFTDIHGIIHCVCVCVCVRACARACACKYVCLSPSLSLFHTHTQGFNSIWDSSVFFCLLPNYLF